MLNLIQFFTVQNGQGGGNAGNGAIPFRAVQPIASDQTGQLFQIGSNHNDGNVFNLFLEQAKLSLNQGNISDSQNAGDDFIQGSQKGVLESDNPLLTKTPSLDPAQLLSSTDSVAQDMETLDTLLDFNLLAEIEQTLALNQRAFEAQLQQSPLSISKESINTTTLPNIAQALNVSNSDAAILFNGLNGLAETAKNGGKANPLLFFQSSDTSNAGLSALLGHLTPEDITAIQNFAKTPAQTSETGDIPEAIERIFAAFVAIVAPQAQAAQTGAQTTTDLKRQPFAAPANSLGNGSVNDTPANSKNIPISSGMNGLALGDLSGELGDLEGDFETLMKASLQKKYAGNPTANLDLGQHNTTNAGTNSASNAPTTLPQFQSLTLPGMPFGLTGSLLSQIPYGDQVAEQLGLSLTGQNHIGQGSLSALVSQAQSAAQSHPATHMIAASMSKAGVLGQDTNINLRLDPPDLGRINVEMKFSADKKIKAIVTAEKPETFMMLQRDAQVLERALQDAGLDSDGGLSFELAEDGQFFDQHNQRGGGHDDGNLGAQGDNNDDELEIIETTMTWAIDPETGHTHYSIWA